MPAENDERPGPDPPADEPAASASGGDDIGATRPPRKDGAHEAMEGWGPGVTARFRSDRKVRADISLRTDEILEENVFGPGSHDRYSLLGEIARGGMGAVLKIADNDIRRPVAMKVILGQDSDALLERFLEEAQITGQLEHPNIVPVHELGVDAEGKVYFTMKLVRGEPLSAVLEGLADRKAGHLADYPLSQLLQIFLKVCDAVAFAHSKGVIHRDVKPENIMVGDFGEVLVMDWGLAKVAGFEDTVRDRLVETLRSSRETGRTLAGEVLGTPSFMPPEQAAGRIEEVDERSDVFALGGILYGILCHEAPYAGASVEEVLKKAVKRSLAPPQRRSPWLKIPSELESVCMKAMAAEPVDRYASVEALAADIRAFIDRRLLSAHRYGPLARAVRFAQRHPALTLAGGVAAVLLSLGAALTGVLRAESQANAARAREQTALVSAERARAEAETLRAEKAERETAEALTRAADADAALEKGRAVSAALRAAELELGDVALRLKRTFFSTGDQERIRGEGLAVWPRVQAFERTLPEDTATQACWLAAKGLLSVYAGEKERALQLFERSRQKDPDVVYGWLIEAMYRFVQYLWQQDLPVGHPRRRRIEFEEVPAETEEMKEERERCEILLRDAVKARVWGESASGEFMAAITGFRKIHEGGFEEAERGLSAAVALPEMLWVRSELLVIRARVRYMRNDFAGGIRDAEAVLRDMPESRKALRALAHLRRGRSVVDSANGLDSADGFREAIAVYDRLDKVAPEGATIMLQRGVAWQFFGDHEARMGRDPKEAYRKAIEDATEALRLWKGPFIEIAHRNRANAWWSLSSAPGLDAAEAELCFRNTIAEAEAILSSNRDDPLGHLVRGMALHTWGVRLAAAGRDPREFYEKALPDLDAMVRSTPMDPFPWTTRAMLHLSMADAGQSEASVRSALGKAIADADQAVKVGRSDVDAHLIRVKVLKAWGLFDMNTGADPGDRLNAALAGIEEILRLDPEETKALEYRGDAFSHLGSWERHRGGDGTRYFEMSLAAYDAALSKAPASCRLHVLRGLQLERLGRFDEAVRAYEAAIGGGETSPVVRKWLERAKAGRKK